MKKPKARTGMGVQPAETAGKQISRNEVTTTFSLYSFFQNNGIWVSTAIISILVLVIFHDFILGNLFYLFKDVGSDSLNMTYPSFVHISNYLRREGFPLWSFSQGMGQNVATSLNDPFTWIVYLAGADAAAYSMIWMEIIKIFVTAYVFYRFLQYWNLTVIASLMGTMLYSFSGFIMIGSGWTLFSTEACYLALLLLGFEQLYQKNSWYLFPLAVCLMTVLQPFDLYLYGLFLIGYFILRHFTGENPSWKKFLQTSLNLAILSLLGIMISFFFLMFFIQIILDSPRIGGSSSYFDQLYSQSLFFTEKSNYYSTAILRFFHNDMVGNGARYSGWFNYLEAPMFYIGLFPLIMFPQIFFLEGRLRRTGYAVFLVIALIPLIFPFFRYSLWLFTGDYFRGYSLFLSLPLLLFGISAFSSLDNGRKINPYVLLATSAVLLLLLYFPYQGTPQMVRAEAQSIVRNFIVLYTVVLLLFTQRNYHQFLSVGLVFLIMVEIGLFNYKTLKQRDVLTNLEMNQKAGYNDYAVEALAFLKSNDHQFYRVNKGFSSSPAMHASINDAKVQGFFGTRSYSSFNQKYYIRFQEEMDIITKGNETMSRWSVGLARRPLLQHLASTKYQLIRGAIPAPIAILYDSIGMFGDVRLLKNRNFLPLGFTYDQILPLSTFRKATTLQKELIMQKTCIIDDSLLKGFEAFPRYPMTDSLAAYTFDDLSADVVKRKADTLTITNFRENRIEGTIAPKTRKILFFSIPYDRGWHARIDGRDAEFHLCNIGFSGLIVEPGKHKIELFYRPPYYYGSMLVSIVGILIYLGAVLWKKKLLKK